MRLLMLLFILVSIVKAQSVAIPLLTIKLGPKQSPEIFIGPFSLDEPIDGVPIESEWALAETDVPYLDLNPIEYVNRAACAVNSSRPTKSFNVVIDSMNVAKAAYRMGMATGREPKELTRMAVRRFRYGVMELIQIISQKLISGTLPMLPHENSGELKEYSDVMSRCRLDEYCEDLDQYISDIWNRGHKRWREVDNFEKEHFFNNKKKDYRFGCYRQLKFSPLANNFFNGKPTKESLEKVAKAHLQQNQILEECGELYQVESLESSSYQGELLNLDSSNWNKYGFDFWNSLKLYFSWAWRNSKEVEELAYPFEYLFRSVDIEDSVMLVPNGCYSITKPRCDSAFLNEQHLRDFAKKSYEQDISTFDHLRFLPEGASNVLLDSSLPATVDNVAEYSNFSSMESWGENFRKNFTRSRGVMKGRLQSALSNLTMITNALSPDDLFQELKVLSGGEKSFVSEISSANLKEELYFLCSEFTMLDFEALRYREELARLTSGLLSDAILSSVDQKQLNTFYDYYLHLNEKVKTLCSGFEQISFWKDTEEIDRSGFRDWMKEVVFPDGYPQDERERVKVSSSKVLLYGGAEKSVVCYSAVDCARNVLESIVNLYSVGQYLQTYFAPLQTLRSPSLNNPYAEATACKVYDPWWRLKKGIFNLVSDLTTGLVGQFNPTPFFVDIDLSKRKVVSFNQLLEDGVIKFDPNFDKKRLLYWAGVEFGPLMGASCSVAVSNTHSAVHDGKHFLAGITVSACGENESENIISTGSGEKSQISGCFSCTLNFENAALEWGQLNKIPIVGPSFYLIRGLVRFFEGVFDPVDTPHRWEVDINNVLETYRRYGEIPKKCVRSLRRGHYCLETEYEYAVSKIFQRDYGRSVKKVIQRGNRISVEGHGCQYPVFNISTKKLSSSLKDGNVLEALEEASYCEWNR